MRNDVEAYFGALADPTRRRVIELLGDRARRAGELAEAAGTSAPVMSRHLRILLEAGFVADERRSDDARVRVFHLQREPVVALTDEIDAWWVRGPINFFDASRATAMRIEAGVGGRVLEVYDDASGDSLELGRITVWEPG